MDFDVPADDGVKMKESEKRETLKKTEKLWNVNVTVIPVIISALGTFRKGLVLGDLEIRREEETIRATPLLRSACGDFLSLRLQWKTIN